MSPPLAPPPQHVNVFFRLVVVAGGAFVVTILAYVSVLFGDPDAPVNRFLDRNAPWLFAGEALAVIAFGLLGMALDRRQTLRHLAADPPLPPAPGSDEQQQARP